MRKIKLGSIELEIKKLDQAGIDDARALVYDAYVNERKWEINEQYPYEVKTNHQGKKMMVNKYDDLAMCTWFGVYHKQKLIACVRITERLNGLLELEKGANSSELLQKTSQYPNILEIGRTIVHKDYRSAGIYALLVKIGLEECYKRKISACGCSSAERSLQFLNMLAKHFPDGTIIRGVTYSNDIDPDENAIFIVDYEKGHVAGVINLINKRLGLSTVHNSQDQLKQTTTNTPAFWSSNNTSEIESQSTKTTSTLNPKPKL